MIPHQRMEQILAVIEANPGITGQDIAAACAVPWSTIQNDLTILLSVTENRIPLYTNADGPEITGDDDDDDEDYDDDDEDDDDDDDDDLDDTIKPEHRWFLENYTRRNVPLHLTLGEALQVLDLPYIDEKHPKLLSLKQKILDNLDLDHQGSCRYIKGNMAPAAGVSGEILLFLEQAVKRRHEISFIYKSKPGTAAPLGLIYYSRLRQWYLVALAEGIYKTFSLSKMQGIRELPRPFKYPEDFSLRTWLAPRWGIEFGEPMQVKVRFSNRSQTFAKVRKDVAHRQCVLSEENGGQTLLYEDTIIGKNEFIAWILGFGSAAEVLEPSELRGEIIARVRAALTNYK